jgi:hypothetical protein
MENLTALLSREAIVGGSNAYFTPSWALYVLPAALAYSFLAASLRHRRIRTSESNHPYPTKESYASMTDDEAFEMINQMAELEFPTLFEKALQFALFRVCSHLPNPAKISTNTSPSPPGRPMVSRPSVPCSPEPLNSRPQAQRESATPTLGFSSPRYGPTSQLTNGPLQPLPG